MLELKVHDGETEVLLRFEHSLRSLSKWESKNKKAFLATPTKTHEVLIDYYQCMLLDGADPTLVYRLSPQQLDDLTEYISDTRTASSVPDRNSGKPSSETVTSELIYYWMTALKINWEAQDWHLSRLMMLISITNFKMQPPEKQDKQKLYDLWKQRNKQNKERFGITG